MKFKDMKSLEKAILDSCEEKFQNEVAKMVRKKVNDGIKEEVYNGYSPQVYKRNYRLYDYRNHRKEVQKKEKTIQGVYFHRAYDENGKDLSKLIILGQAGAMSYGDVGRYNDVYIQKYIASGATDSKPFYKSRNFIKHAKENISKSDIIKALGG